MPEDARKNHRNHFSKTSGRLFHFIEMIFRPWFWDIKTDIHKLKGLQRQFFFVSKVKKVQSPVVLGNHFFCISK